MKNLAVDNAWTLFLDRDGVINKRNFDGYITEKADFSFLPEVKSAIKSFSEIFGRIIIVTNQQGVGKNIMTKSNLDQIHRYMLNEIEKEGGRIDAIFSATNLKGAENDRRKPKPNMGLEAKKKFPEIDFNKSIMVGDTDSDIEFGTNLGMKTVLIKSQENVDLKPDFAIGKLIDLKKLLK